jgi:hypothetical protein
MIELTDSCIVMLPEPKELPDSIYVVRYKLVFARQAFHYRDWEKRAEGVTRQQRRPKELPDSVKGGNITSLCLQGLMWRSALPIEPPPLLREDYPSLRSIDAVYSKTRSWLWFHSFSVLKRLQRSAYVDESTAGMPHHNAYCLCLQIRLLFGLVRLLGPASELFHISITFWIQTLLCSWRLFVCLRLNARLCSFLLHLGNDQSKRHGNGFQLCYHRYFDYEVQKHVWECCLTTKDFRDTVLCTWKLRDPIDSRRESRARRSGSAVKKKRNRNRVCCRQE